MCYPSSARKRHLHETACAKHFPASHLFILGGHSVPARVRPDQFLCAFFLSATSASSLLCLTTETRVRKRPSLNMSSDKDSLEKAGPLSAPPHTLDGHDVAAAYQVDPRLGLCEDQIKALQEQYGPNRLKPPPKPSLVKIFLRNVANAMTMVLSEAEV